jgi:AhpD family alkylhydroperoxidase
VIGALESAFWLTAAPLGGNFDDLSSTEPSEERGESYGRYGSRLVSATQARRGDHMIIEDRHEVDRDIEETFGLVPEFFRRVPDYLLPTEWASFKSLQLSDQTAIPNKYKELIGLAVSGATRCRYCCYFHAEAARLFGATEDEITETALIAKNTMGWSTYLNAMQFDYDQFVAEFDQISAHIRQQMAAGAPA